MQKLCKRFIWTGYQFLASGENQHPCSPRWLWTTKILQKVQRIDFGLLNSSNSCKNLGNWHFPRFCSCLQDGNMLRYVHWPFGYGTLHLVNRDWGICTSFSSPVGCMSWSFTCWSNLHCSNVFFWLNYCPQIAHLDIILLDKPDHNYPLKNLCNSIPHSQDASPCPQQLYIHLG